MSEADDLVERSRHGDQDAARRLVELYFDRLLPLARRRIGRRLAGRFDAEDVVQAAFFTFFVRLKADAFQPADRTALYRLLVRITVNKALRQVAHHTAAKRDPTHELAHGDGQEWLGKMPAAGPLPEAAVLAIDELERFLNGLPPADRQVLELRLQGHTTEEIARRLDSYDRKVRRALVRIRAAAARAGLTE
jgi:RNA polymerase sigma-70 factor (ECF subfamily)